MKKLELKDIAAYLPYGPLGWHIKGHLCKIDYKMISQYGAALANYKPILRPMSDLTKEITHRGEKFVPMARIAIELDYAFQSIYFKERNDAKLLGITWVNYNDERCAFGINREFKGEAWAFQIDGKLINPIVDAHRLYDKLSEWMFDYRGLIPAGLAVDVNTLERNPYEP